MGGGGSQPAAFSPSHHPFSSPGPHLTSRANVGQTKSRIVEIALVIFAGLKSCFLSIWFDPSSGVVPALDPYEGGQPEAFSSQPSNL